MTPAQKKAAQFYAKATPKQAMRRSLRKFRVKGDLRKTIKPA
jgi:hypothetical protein